MNKTTTEEHNQLSSHYADLIAKCVPRSPELIYNMFHHIPADLRPKRILDLGCGSGNLTEHMLKVFPEAEIDAVDISEEILNESRKRFMHTPNVRYIQADFKTIHLPPGSYDLVMSGIALQIDNPDKTKLYKEVYQSLSSGGIFIFADQTPDITGNTQENIPISEKETLKWHLGELEKAGFNETDPQWEIVLARK